jgi:RHS repeat-associated protein
MLLSTGKVLGQEDRSPKRGFQSPGSYALTDLESISLTNGNMIVRLPLASLPAGRGGSPGHALYLIYNSKLWDSKKSLGENGSIIVGEEQKPLTTYTYEELMPRGQGGWSYGYYYQLELTRRTDLDNSTKCTGGSTDAVNNYIWKLNITFPDGSVHEFRPSGYNDYFDDGYFDIDPNGYRYSGCGGVRTPANSTGMTYYSTDGTFMRLEVEHTSDASDGSSNPWTLYMPNGTKVTSAWINSVYEQRIYDRNDNYIEIKNRTITDQLGRSITLELGAPGGTDTVRTKGFEGEELVTQVVHTQNWIHKTYKSGGINAPEDKREKTITYEVGGVGQVILPSQTGGLSYTFGYNGKATVPQSGDYSTGWGELSSITLPSGAKASYTYSLDTESSLGIKPTAAMVLKRYPTQKVLTYRDEYDRTGSPQNTSCNPGEAGCIKEEWTYEVTETSGSVTSPDGGTATQFFNDTSSGLPESGLAYKTVKPDGGVSEQVWEKNLPHQHEQKAYNWYVRAEFNSIANASGVPVKTAVKDYDYDKNGNLLAVYEYDWINYSDIPRDTGNQRISLSRDSNTGRLTGIPGLSLKRATRNTYYNQAPAASSSPSCMTVPTSDGCQNIYVFRNLNRRLYNLIKSSDISDESQTLARTEFIYDNTETKGNLTEQRSWDSAKAPALPASLSASNAVITSRAYDQLGNVTLTTDARGVQTEVTYGNIAGPTGQVSGLYPTQTIAALGRPEQRTSTLEYDIYTGAVIKATDVDNGVSTTTDYDVFGRPALVKAAINTAEESHTVTEYSDLLRRIITRSDLTTKDDKKLVSIQHYDQLGRVRLTRQLEDACAGCDTDETKGIKVQTRYYVDEVNHLTYQLSSNPYRESYSGDASTDSTRGWTRSKSDVSGRVVEVQTYSGITPPSPWGNNTGSTGMAVTNYDAEFTTVTDQAGRVRRSMVDALGRLLRVDEPNEINNPTSLGSVAAPAQATSYTYDALGTLKQVRQGGTIQNGQYIGGQTRTFNYSSLSRLTYATNPESGTIEYQYDANGNLVLKIDPRTKQGSLTLADCSIPYTGTRIATCYKYDGLNRLETRKYNDGTPNVTYSYDQLTYGRGKLISVSSAVSTTTITQYDALGRVRASKQETQGATEAYTFEYNYNLAGGLISQKYPSGRVFVTEYDSMGRMSGVKKQGANYYAGADSNSQDYEANRIKYTAHGAISAIKLGNGLWEHTGFNSRLQAVEIGLGTSATDSSKLLLGYSYGTTINNGNVLSQTISAPGLNLTQSYTYDQLNRLKSFQETGGANQTWSQVYSYDQYGNRTIDNGLTTDDGLFRAESPATDPNNNRISAAGYVYDDAGNLKQRPNNKSYIYDAENKQTSYQENGVEKGSYFYDGDGRRVKKIANGATTIFVYNMMGQLIAEYGGEPVNNGTRYLTSDHLGSTRVVTDSTGNVRERHDYLPFGEEIYSANIDYSGRGNVADQGYKVGDIRQKFNQKERDLETKLDYFLARYYSSAMGRFTSPDEFTGGPKELLFFAEKASANPMFYANIANPQSLNKYQYCLNNPLRYVDPDGHDVLDYDLIVSGPNQVPKTPHPEISDVSTLGPKDTPTGGFFLLNLRTNFEAGDRIEDYKPLRTAFILDGKGVAEVRSGSQENPSKSQMAVSGQSRYVYDNPGIGVSGATKASIGTGKLEMAFVAGEYNTKTKQLSSKVAYYKMTLVFKGGKVDVNLSTATMISRDEFIKLTGKNLPKDKNTKQPCPECSLQR